ncbi:MAG: DUF3224 domain-containing protein [Candidatus Acidiferrales bacterium]
MALHASGTFEVKLTPQPPEDKADGSTLGRMSIDKQFHGDLEGNSKGQMLTAGTDVKGSAGHVAIERITGTLKGRRGAFRNKLLRWCPILAPDRSSVFPAR